MKNKNKLKKFSKSKLGNFTIVAIVIVPLVIVLVSLIVANNRRKTVYREEVLIQVDSFCDYVNNKYGIYLSTGENAGNEDVCYYGQASRSAIKNEFDDFIKKIDGYNEFWKYEVSGFANEKNMDFKIILHVFLPKLQTLKVIDYWGINDGAYKTEDGYYANHKTAMTEYFNNPPKIGEDSTITLDDTTSPKFEGNRYWIYERIEVKASCK